LVEVVSSMELMNRVAQLVIKTNEKWYWKLLRYIMFFFRSWFFDLKYKTISLSELEQILREYDQYLKRYKLEYEIDYFDCDDYAVTFKAFATRRTKANSVGIAIGIVSKPDEGILGGHAWNIVILDNGNIVFVEPQTREWFEPNVSSDGFIYELQAVIW